MRQIDLDEDIGDGRVFFCFADHLEDAAAKAVDRATLQLLELAVKRHVLRPDVTGAEIAKVQLFLSGLTHTFSMFLRPFIGCLYRSSFYSARKP